MTKFSLYKVTKDCTDSVASLFFIFYYMCIVAVTQYVRTYKAYLYFPLNRKIKLPSVFILAQFIKLVQVNAISDDNFMILYI